MQTVVRRRRSRRHRRNRLIRRGLVAVVLLGLTFGISTLAVQYLAPSLSRTVRHSQPSAQESEAVRQRLVEIQQQSLRSMEDRKVYPYSVVPGGVRDVAELKWAAEHDPVVAAHYAGFDYDHGRVVRLVLARTAYISYRIGNKVYWTRRRISLKKGEELITDGKITARTRCANRVEEMPQQATSSSEPPAAKFEEPVKPSTGTAVTNPPVPFESALLNRSGLPGLGPTPPLSLYDPFSPGTWVPINPPQLPIGGVCGPGKKPKEGSGTGGKKGKGNPCGEGSGEVPEPGTWLLVASGLGLIYWKARHRFARA